MRKSKIVMHTHWDREWYFTKEETQVLLENHMKEVFDFLEDNKDVKYMLDGQTVMIDDLLEINSNMEHLLKKYIYDGQLQVGPWYTQTDLMIVTGESIIRNLKMGIDQSLKYTKTPMLVGYAPDTFGHNSNMPQIYKDFGIESTVFWRGFSELKAQKSDFIWNGCDGSKIIGVNLSTGYQGAKYLEEEKEELSKRMKKIYNVLDSYSATDNRLIMNGHDQMPIQKNIKEVKKNLEFLYPKDKIEISTLQDYIDGLKEKKLEEVDGELVDSKHARIHRTINSTRMDIKNLNAEIENKIFHQLEPLMVYLNQYGIDYPHQLIEKVLKMLFGCHAHDSIGGCNSDKVNQDIKQRLLQVDELVTSTINLYLRKVAMSLTNNDDNKIVVINPYPYDRETDYCKVDILTKDKDFSLYKGETLLNYTVIEQEEIMAGMIDRQIAARQKDYKLYKSKIKVFIPKIKSMSELLIDIKYVKNKSKNIESSHYLEITKDKINLKGKKLIEGFIKIEALYDAGDSYDYSPPHENNLEILNKTSFQYSLDEKIDSGEEYLYKINAFDKNEYIKSKFKIKINLNKRNSDINVNVRTINKDKNTKIRIVINTGDKFKTILSGNHLSEIKRPIFNNKEMEVWEKENWSEKPVAIETFQDYIRTKNFGIISLLSKEYEVLQRESNEVAITMYRTFDKLGKSNLVNRPGRPSGIEIDTPDNQMIGIKIEQDIFITFDSKNTSKKAMLLKNPLVGIKAEKVNSFNINYETYNKTNENNINFDLGNNILSSFKCSDDDNNIIRIFNPNDKVDSFICNKDLYEVNLKEEKKEKKLIKKGTKIKLNTNQFKTLMSEV